MIMDACESHSYRITGLRCGRTESFHQEFLVWRNGSGRLFLGGKYANSNAQRMGCALPAHRHLFRCQTIFETRFEILLIATKIDMIDRKIQFDTKTTMMNHLKSAEINDITEIDHRWIDWNHWNKRIDHQIDWNRRIDRNRWIDQNRWIDRNR